MGDLIDLGFGGGGTGFMTGIGALACGLGAEYTGGGGGADDLAGIGGGGGGAVKPFVGSNDGALIIGGAKSS